MKEKRPLKGQSRVLVAAIDAIDHARHGAAMTMGANGFSLPVDVHPEAVDMGLLGIESPLEQGDGPRFYQIKLGTVPFLMDGLVDFLPAETAGSGRRRYAKLLFHLENF